MLHVTHSGVFVLCPCTHAHTHTHIAIISFSEWLNIFGTIILALSFKRILAGRQDAAGSKDLSFISLNQEMRLAFLEGVVTWLLENSQNSKDPKLHFISDFMQTQ